MRDFAARIQMAGTILLIVTASAFASRGVQTHQEVCGQSLPDERVVVGAAGGLRYAVVTVESVRDGEKPERDTTLVLNNLGCRFEPHVQVAKTGQWLEIRNGDPLLHNADARLSNETLFNDVTYPAPEGDR